MTLVQYGDYFYLYVLVLALIPAVILGVLEKNIKYYGVFISILMIIAVMGMGKIFPLFLIGEIVLIKGYSVLRKKTDNKYLYYIVLFLSMSPVIIFKVSAITIERSIGFIGLSYLNFKAIQMIIEIYDEAIKEVSIIKTLYFFLFFPTLISGPIDRSRRFEDDLERKISRNEYINEYLYHGIKRIIRGIVYKFILANLINALWMSKISEHITFSSSLNYMYAYSLYLFFDFAGYTAFAVGTSYILGIRMPENFNKPFLSKDMKEFWTRWHISLSKWFGDYIYSRFVLNSMRKKRFKNRFVASHIGQLLTMLIMGAWHDLKWFYIIYGLYQGAALVGTDIYQRKSKFYKAHKKEKWFQYIEIVATFHIACFGLLLFSGYLFGS
ncbi:D-alanyl-lipoteichoic acid biosynthesis protein DltB [Clostridium chromiireducens]|uniref:Teichoic acid D-alanyltransferase n=1 Tax=Clostridium chromiireducens TaxID=225345 RepID=A0A1V4J0V6_9CLOT|nr:D-alanyl-lipoteichoic acid biosynthesis protein DltB [Clostridium chromiireducens]OPJ65789.1 peptidoglycan O-acetyltransferase [Clostridium chromiireducens]RII36757.1 D-alanyl-lipoteichoic acid biosynthesis protein DltB [Clostridium chromiireducens]